VPNYEIEMNAALQLVETGIRGGFWEGLLSGALSAPDLRVTHMEKTVPGVQAIAVEGRPGNWAVRVPIPAETLSEGVQTYLIVDAATDARLAHFTVIAGQDQDQDLRMELDLLRAELDLLKRAFRRHCVETAG
jgi:hypothetical protein